MAVFTKSSFEKGAGQLPFCFLYFSRLFFSSVRLGASCYSGPGTRFVCKYSGILFPRARFPFGQHQEVLALGTRIMFRVQIPLWKQILLAFGGYKFNFSILCKNNQPVVLSSCFLTPLILYETIPSSFYNPEQNVTTPPSPITMLRNGWVICASS